MAETANAPDYLLQGIFGDLTVEMLTAIRYVMNWRSRAVKLEKA